MMNKEQVTQLWSKQGSVDVESESHPGTLGFSGSVVGMTDDHAIVYASWYSCKKFVPLHRLHAHNTLTHRNDGYVLRSCPVGLI